MWGRFKSQERVEFLAKAEHLEIFPHPVPAAKLLPSYFKNLKPQSSPHPKSGTVKRCVPFLDAMTQGFIIPMWADVLVRASNGELSVDFPQNFPMKSSLSQHDYEQIQGHPLSNEPYGEIPIKWHNPWGIKTPKGWSCLFTSPLNHLEKRFKILDGIVDTDAYHNQVNFPFIWTGGDGEFFIQRGEPLVQVIPFQRAEYSCHIVEQDEKKAAIIEGKLGTKMRNSYRSFFWHKLRGK